MVDRVKQYYQYPVKPDFVKHMFDGIGLSADESAMLWEIRNVTADTQYYADKANLTLKQYSTKIGRVHRREMDELIRLAQIGYEHEKRLTSADYVI